MVFVLVFVLVFILGFDFVFSFAVSYVPGDDLRPNSAHYLVVGPPFEAEVHALPFEMFTNIHTCTTYTPL